MNTDTNLEDRLTGAFEEPMTPAQRAWLDTRVTAALERTDPGRPRFRVPLTRSLLLVAALVVLLPTIFIAAASMFSTEAPFGMGNADQFDAEVAAAKAETPIPPGATWPPHLERAVDRSASYAVGLGRGMVEYNAYCLWLGDWHRAQETGDAARATAAAAALNEARGWETFNDASADQTFRDGINGVIDAVQRGNAATVLHELELNCGGVWEP